MPPGSQQLSKTKSSLGSSFVHRDPSIDKFRLSYATSINHSALTVRSETGHKRIRICDWKHSNSTADVVAVKILPKIIDSNESRSRLERELKQVMADGFKSGESSSTTAAKLEAKATALYKAEMSKRLSKSLKELKILLNLDHKNLPRTCGFIETASDLLAISVYEKGGTLVERLERYGANFSEEKASEFTRQIASGLGYLHGKGIVHCNLDPEHIVFKSSYRGPESDANLVITGFSESITVSPTQPQKVYQLYGFGPFTSPDRTVVVQHASKVDTWSLGAIVFFMLSGSPPYPEADDPEGKKGPLIFPGSSSTSISGDAKTIMVWCLRARISDRASIAGLQNHKWLTNPVVSNKLGKHLQWKTSLENYKKRIKSSPDSQPPAEEKVVTRWERENKITKEGYILKRLKKLGEGAYGSVYQGQLSQGSEPPSTIAVKTISKKVDYETILHDALRAIDTTLKSNPSTDFNALSSKIGKIVKSNYEKGAKHTKSIVMSEIGPWQKLDHKNILKFKGAWYHDPHEVFLFMEEAKGGTLLSYLKKHGRLSDRELSFLAHQLYSGVNHLDNVQIVHRDIKADNILLEYPGDTPIEKQIFKICDFGSSKCLNGKKLQGYCSYGTMIYTAPEVLSLKPYDCKSNVWPITVLLIEAYLGSLINGYGLFWVNNPGQCDRKDLEYVLEMKGKNKKDLDTLSQQGRMFLNIEAAIVKKIVKEPLLSLSGPGWVGLSDNGKATLAKGFVRDPGKRCTASSILKSNPWFESYGLSTVVETRKVHDSSRTRSPSPSRGKSVVSSSSREKQKGSSKLKIPSSKSTTSTSSRAVRKLGSTDATSSRKGVPKKTAKDSGESTTSWSPSFSRSSTLRTDASFGSSASTATLVGKAEKSTTKLDGSKKNS